jgi:hypothetical protein
LGSIPARRCRPPHFIEILDGLAEKQPLRVPSARSTSLALEKGAPGRSWHAIADAAVPYRQIGGAAAGRERRGELEHRVERRYRLNLPADSARSTPYSNDPDSAIMAAVRNASLGSLSVLHPQRTKEAR